MPIQPLSLGFKSNIRIESLAATDFLTLTCKQCNRSHRVTTWQLHDRFPPAMRIMDLHDRMTCRGCGHRGEMDRVLWRAVPPVKEVYRSHAIGERMPKPQRFDGPDDAA